MFTENCDMSTSLVGKNCILYNFYYFIPAFRFSAMQWAKQTSSEGYKQKLALKVWHSITILTNSMTGIKKQEKKKTPPMNCHLNMVEGF